MCRQRRSIGVRMKWCLLVVALAHLSLSEAQAPEFAPEIVTQPVPGQIQIEGSIKTLFCRASGNPAPVYRWLHDEQFASENSSGGSLRIQNLQVSDAGLYRCLAVNPLGGVLSKAADVKVASPRPFAQTGPREMSVGQGSFVRLPLPDINTLGMEITWQENNVTLDADGPYNFISLNKDLILLSVDNNHNKEYRAKVVYFMTAFESISSPYNVRVIEENSTDQNNPTSISPEFVKRPEDVFVTDGTTAEFECVINARPITALDIQWYKVAPNGSRTPIVQDSSLKYLLSLNRRLLTIPNVNQDDSSFTYMCEGQLSSTGEALQASANLTIYVAPSMLTNGQGQTIERDFSQSVLLSCQAQGFPDPSLEWFFNGRPLSLVSSDRHTVFANGSLAITNVDLPDAGKYQCFAINDAGEDYLSLTLKVNSAPPQIIKTPEDLMIVEGSAARFFCEVTGAPEPQVTWTVVRDGSETEVTGQRFQQFRDHLLIVNVEKADSAVYRCQAVNIKGEESAQAQLTVITRTQIIRPPQNQTVIISTQVRFECGITQDDNAVPVWEWFFYKNNDLTNERQLSNTGRFQILGDGTLIVNGVSAQDIGLYKCHVISAGGNDSRIASLQVIELPRAPIITSVTLNPRENNSVVVVWTRSFNGNSPLIKYIITFRQENPNGNNEGVGWEVYPDVIDPASTSHIVSNLNPSRYYRFRISAVNAVGEGNASQPMPNPAIKMPTQPPSSPPRNFFCTQGQEKEIVATWDPPEESTWNGDLLGYVIRYKVANLPDITLQVSTLPGPTRRSYTIQYLVSYKQYAVSLAAYNEEGTGVFTSSFYVWTREGRPTDSPKNVVATATNSTTVVLEWDPPNPGEINGRNLGYMIEIHQGDSLVRSFFIGSDDNNMEGRQETQVNGLQKFTEYNFTIACRTSPGLGPYSTAVAVKTQEDVPGPVRDLLFDNVQDRSLRVTWSEPSEVNGILTGYLLEHEKKNMPATRIPLDLPPSVTSYTIRDLIPVTNYTIYVSARTIIGAGQIVSADIQSGVPPELPHPPYNLGFSNIGARTVLLQFFPGFDGKTSITRWIVLASEGDGQDYNEIFSVSNPTAREINVENLKPYTRYQLKIIAENIVGQSAASEPTRPFETLQAPPGVPPGNVTVRALNATALRISWTPIPSQEWNGIPRGYKIDHRMWSTEAEDDGLATVQETDWTTVRLENGINMDSYILPQLQEWMDYQIRMISYNDVGTSHYSPITTARTRESTPSASPSNVAANPLSSTEILVTWSPVPRLQQNGLILGYKVLYRPIDNSDTPVYKDVKGKNTTNVTLRGLRKYVSYSIQILAYTRMGDGRLSPEVIKKTDEDVPGPPIIIYFPNVTYTTAVVVWNSPSEPNGIITGYKVSYRQRDQTLTDRESELGPNVYEYAVDGLQRETYYVFSVRAKTRLGWGETASVLVLTMENRDRPEQPRKPTVGSLQVYARNITIAWQPGTDNYSPIRNFTVQYRMRDSQWTLFPHTIPPSATSYTVTGLRPNSFYQFRVAATNDIGISDYSEPSIEVRTQSDKPDGAPQNLRVVAITRTSIEVSWQRPEEDTWNGLLLSYVVQYRQVQQQDYQEDTVQFGTNSVRLSGLVISQTYEVQVLAVNAKGRGPSSTPATIYVGEAAPTASPSNVFAVNRSSSSIEVSWIPPPPETQNGGLSGYKVVFHKNSTSVEEEQIRISAETTLLLEGLETFTFYFISVQAYNLAGEGPRSALVTARTSEGVPSAPGTLSFTNITMHQLMVSFLPPQHPNGYILLYEMEYFPRDRNPFDPLPPKRVLRANETRVLVLELEERVEYVFRVSANTSIGRGQAREAFITTGPQPGSAKAPSKPTVTQQDSFVLLTWVDGESGSTPTYGYLIQYKKRDEDKYMTLQQEITSEHRALISLTNLNPNTGYHFRIIALNGNGISEPSVPSDVFVTPSFAVAKIAKPFHAEWWFVVIIALTGVIVILVIISLLCLLTRRKKGGEEMKRSQTANTVISEPSEPEEGGFPTYEMRQSRRNIPPRNGSIKNIYARAPPRPSPASVAYSDDDDAMSMAKPPIPDDSSSSVTDKPSELDDSTEPSDEESDAESEKVPASPPPPAFSSVYANSDNVRQSWRFQNPNTAYAYTDSEADSSHYAFSLNNGQLVVNNVAGARTPLTGFSSFV